MNLFLNENYSSMSVSFLNLWGVRSQCCDHLAHPCSSATNDLSLATLLKTAVFVPFFLTRNAFVKDAEPVFFCIHMKLDLSDTALQLCLSARRESNKRGKGTPAKWASVKQRDAVRLYVSKTNYPVPVSRHCAHGVRPDRLIINKRTRDCIRVCHQLSHEITKKGD